MADFHQMGIVTTLHALYEAFDRELYLKNLERKIEEYSRHLRIGLLLPSLHMEIQNSPVLDRILDEIGVTDYDFEKTGFICCSFVFTYSNN